MSALVSRPRYTRTFLERYGRRLTPDDVRLVQGFRGLPAAERIRLLEATALLVIESARRRAR